MSDAEIAYEYNWSSLVGCLQALLTQTGLPAGAARVSAVSGDGFLVEPAFDRVGYVPRRLDALTEDLAALGLQARVDVWRIGRWRPPILSWRVGRRIRRTLSMGRAVAAYGAVPNEFGLIVGYDAQRGAYTVRGPLTDEIGGLLRAAALPGGEAEWLALVIPEGPGSEPARPTMLAARAAVHALEAKAAVGLGHWIAALESGAEIEARVHAYRAQALAAARGEVSRFWRELADSERDEVEARGVAALVVPSGRQALIFSRFATLFPFPAGGDLGRGGRTVGARILREALAQEQELAPLLEAVARAPH